MITRSRFRPAWWLRNRHLQTIVPNTFRGLPQLALRRERVELPDGDFVDADWTSGSKGPIVVLLHGLEGSRDSRYAAWTLKRVHDAGYRGVLLHFRGCSGEPNRQANGYHSGHTADFDHFIRRLRQREPDTPLAAVGYSLGGNALLKWLGEHPQEALLRTAVAVSVPFRLDICADAINRGSARIYQEHLIRRMRQSAKRKLHLIRESGLDPDIARLRTFRQFDETLTAPLHGFRDADDYYAQSSSAGFLQFITTPTLVLHALDDPFMTPAIVPDERELSAAVTLELSEGGGHVGFVGGRWPWRPVYWLEERVLAHLETLLAVSAAAPAKRRVNVEIA